LIHVKAQPASNIEHGLWLHFAEPARYLGPSSACTIHAQGTSQPSCVIALTHFTPFAALAGGAMIGLAALLLALFNGRVAGISGIIGGGLRAPPDDLGWRLALLAGLVLAPLIYRTTVGVIEPVTVTSSSAVLVLGGLLVGFGTRLGNGCTSGHGVCGIARLSPRSLAATATFMLSAAATVFVLRHVIGG
jgi:uncharacterized membrane protein YedE/YeeE